MCRYPNQGEQNEEQSKHMNKLGCLIIGLVVLMSCSPQEEAEKPFVLDKREIHIEHTRLFTQDASGTNWWCFLANPKKGKSMKWIAVLGNRPVVIKDGREVLATGRIRGMMGSDKLEGLNITFPTRQIVVALERKLGLYESAIPDPATQSHLLRLVKGIPPRDPGTPPNLIDLSCAYTTSLTNVAELAAGADALTEVPVGTHSFGGVPFDVRGIVFRSSSSEANAALASIPIRSKCQALHFLQGTAAMISARDGRRIGSYKIHYAWGGSEDIPVVIGSEVRDWFYYDDEPVEVSQAPLVWVGLNERARYINSFTRLYLMSWTNPEPDTLIESIDFPDCAPGTLFLIALTAEPSGENTTAKPAVANPDSQTVFAHTLRTLDEAIARRPRYLPFAQAKASLLQRYAPNANAESEGQNPRDK